MQGETGPAGATGATGAQGPAGLLTAADHTIRTFNVSVPDFFGFTYFRNCNAGEIVVGGGYSTDLEVGDAQGWDMHSNFPLDDDTWQVQGDNRTGLAVSLTLYAICVAVP